MVFSRACVLLSSLDTMSRLAEAAAAASAEMQRQQDREISFTNAFNAQRGTLAGFAKCKNREELHMVRDGFWLGLAREICPEAYQPVKKQIVEDFRVAAAAGTSGGFAQTIESARGASGWSELVAAVFAEAEAVGSDLKTIWEGLETGRLEWLNAVARAHALKVKLKDALKRDGDSGEGDVQAAKMVWMYAVALNVPRLEKATPKWAEVAKITTPESPLVGYNSKLWDCRLPEWKPVDIGVQAAAERGGTNLDEAWSA